MNAAHYHPTLGASLDTLARFLRESGMTLSAHQATVAAIEDWIVNASVRNKSSPPGPVRGYQWKTLFLPEFTELRMSCAGRVYHARVEGDDIMYEARSVSPRQLTLAVAGDGRNAWRDLWIRFPGESKWHTASALRRAVKQAETAPPTSPIDAVSVAAASMADALKSALALAQYTNARALAAEKAPVIERRHGQSRRADDILGETCMFD